jgi:hypothetical protein
LVEPEGKVPLLWVKRGRYAGHSGRFIVRHPSGLVKVNIRSHRPVWIPEHWITTDKAAVSATFLERAQKQRAEWKAQKRQRTAHIQYTHNTFMPGGLPGMGKR